ncbi:hypothetical protein JYT48_00400 [Mariprofundus ferrooxydans]|nr:hypothetical protein [Mariprofundus ferrooxydans]
MSNILFWLVLAVIFVFLWWAGFYATKDMRVRKNAMRTDQAKRNLELHAQQQAEAAAKKSGNSPANNVVSKGEN